MMKFFKLMLLLVMFSLCAYGQEVGVTGLKLWTDNDLLENPPGIGIYGASPVTNKLNARIEYNYAAKSQTALGEMPVTANPDPKAEPEIEPIESRVRLHALDLSFLFELIQTPLVNFDVGFVLGLNFLGGGREGAITGLSADWPGAAKFGAGLAVLLKLPQIQNFPLSFNIMFKQQLLRSSSASVDQEDPFSDSINLSRLQIGIGYKF